MAGQVRPPGDRAAIPSSLLTGHNVSGSFSKTYLPSKRPKHKNDMLFAFFCPKMIFAKGIATSRVMEPDAYRASTKKGSVIMRCGEQDCLTHPFPQSTDMR